MDVVTLMAVCAVGLSAPAVDRYAGQFDSASIARVIAAREAADIVDGELSASSDIDQWQPLIDEASRLFGLPAAWIRAVMQVESGGRTMLDGHPIASRAGAMGLMQVMPETYEEMRQRYRLKRRSVRPA